MYVGALLLGTYSIELEQALSSSHISSRGTHTFFLCMSDALLLDDVAHWKIIVINIVFTSLFTGYKNNNKKTYLLLIIVLCKYIREGQCKLFPKWHFLCILGPLLVGIIMRQFFGACAKSFPIILLGMSGDFLHTQYT